MCEVQKDGASGARAKFRRALVILQHEKAENGRKWCEKAAEKKMTKAARLASTTLKFDLTKIDAMSSHVLKDQLAVYRNVLKDPILSKMLWKEMMTVAVRRKLVLDAQTRAIARGQVSLLIACSSEPSESSEPSTEDMIIEDYGYSAKEDAEWEDTDDRLALL
ncbi:hypothetical protein C8J57DRAFT_1215795 [Mycena rebaudengoi]|nr:hypothetical protein C8J57DRAFT_1215795 [Mycena rebaudengoi]